MSAAQGEIRRWFWLLLALFLPTAVAMVLIDLDLRGPQSPNGIISLELCAYADTCAAIVEQWGSRGRDAAMLGLGLDYLFLVAYAGLLGVSLWWRGSRRMPWAALGAGLADAVENFALVQYLQQGGGWAQAAAMFATLKFALLALASFWLLVLLLRRRAGAPISH